MVVSEEDSPWQWSIFRLSVFRSVRSKGQQESLPKGSGIFHLYRYIIYASKTHSWDRSNCIILKIRRFDMNLHVLYMLACWIVETEPFGGAPGPLIFGAAWQCQAETIKGPKTWPQQNSHVCCGSFSGNPAKLVGTHKGWREFSEKAFTQKKDLSSLSKWTFLFGWQDGEELWIVYSRHLAEMRSGKPHHISMVSGQTWCSSVEEGWTDTHHCYDLWVWS